MKLPESSRSLVQAEYLNVGEKVVLESSSFCGRCDLCRSGRVDLCNKGPQFWMAGPSMGFSDYLFAPACCVVPYEGLTPEAASLAEPAGVAYDMVTTADIKHGDRVCLIGPGPIGLMAIPMILRSGADKVVVMGRTGNDARMTAAAALGAETLICDAPLSGIHGATGAVRSGAGNRTGSDHPGSLAIAGLRRNDVLYRHWDGISG